MRKLFEKLIKKTLDLADRQFDIIPEIHSGFRVSRSTQENFVRFGETIAANRKRKKVTIAFLMDVEKALDVLDYNILKKRLVDAPYAPKTKRIVSSFITDRTLYVYDGDTISETVEMSAGAPQGAILSPSLYTICAHDVPIINDEDEGGAQYADDSILWATGRNVREVVAHIERRLKVMERW